jgi:hypothetical protein
MTARRRRKSGSGPSATALIAWVGGARTGSADRAGTIGPVIDRAPEDRAPGDQVAGGRAIFLGRACGLAAGTLLACGSVLAGATHVGDGSRTTDSAPLLNPTPTTPGATADAPGQFGGSASTPAGPALAAPDPVSAQTVTDPSPRVAPGLGKVRRNAPASVEMPAEETQRPDVAPRPRKPSPPATDRAPVAPIAPINPVLDPATRGVGEIAPVGGVLPPTNPTTERADRQFATPRNEQAGPRRGNRTALGAAETVNSVVAPLDNAIKPVTKRPVIQPATQPAMAMLTSLLPIG